MALATPTEAALKNFCRRWDVIELALFGSAARGDDGPESDVDLLVTFSSHAHPTLLDLVRMQDELEALFARPVDLVSRRAVAASRNYIRRDAILRSARVVYAA